MITRPKRRQAQMTGASPSAVTTMRVAGAPGIQSDWTMMFSSQTAASTELASIDGSSIVTRFWSAGIFMLIPMAGNSDWTKIAGPLWMLPCAADLAAPV